MIPVHYNRSSGGLSENVPSLFIFPISFINHFKKSTARGFGVLGFWVFLGVHGLICVFWSSLLFLGVLECFLGVFWVF